MRICIDASVAFNNITARRYITALVNHLVQIDKKNEYILFENVFWEKLRKSDVFLGAEKVPRVICKWPRRLLLKLWEYNFPSIEKFVGSVDIFHSPHFVLPPQKFGKSILTVYDLGYFKRPDLRVNQSPSKHDNQLLLKSLKRVDLIFAISQSTKYDLLEIFNLPENKVKVVYLGVDLNLFHRVNKDVQEKVMGKYGIKEKYILYVIGNIGPRKNILGMVKAFRLFQNQIGFGYKLVLVGKLKGCRELVGKEVERYKIEDKVIFTDTVPDEDLPALMSGARLFVYPSFYEGFGLPVLEAMACGAAVITSNVSSLPEVVGDAGILIDPSSEEEIAEAMLKLASNEELCHVLSDKAQERAKLFTWQKTAEETLKAYDQLYKS